MNDVYLLDLTEDNIELVRQWRNSPEVYNYMYSSQNISAEEQKKWFDKIKNEINSKYWIIKYGEKELGLASLQNIDMTLNSCYWAFYLGDTSIRGSGIGAKVEYLVLDFVFEKLKLNKLRCEVFVFNDKVIKMHEKFGFRREAYYREHCEKNGKSEDVVGLAILRSEWSVLKSFLKQKAYGDQVI